MLGSLAVLRSPSNRARRSSKRLIPAARRPVRAHEHLRHPSVYPCSSITRRVTLTRRGAGNSRARGLG
eukprot:12823090-Alexandrium_andersonii.AAC.1